MAAPPTTLLSIPLTPRAARAAEKVVRLYGIDEATVRARVGASFPSDRR